MRKRKDENDVSESAAAAPQGRLTPMDIQEKVFKSQPGLHGYNEREVDEFLDRITEELARVQAENQRLKEQLAGHGAAPVAAAASVAAGPQIGGEYIAREKEFLRSLATLIQGHAEAVRQDVRRATSATPAAEAAPVAAPAQPADTAPVAAAPLPADLSQPALDTNARELDPVPAGAETAQQDESIRELFWGED